jgi:predicted transcriptional regulator
MGKESVKGTQFYASRGLKSLTIYLPVEVHKKLTDIARHQDRSIQKTARRVVVDFVQKYSGKKA